MVKNTNFIKLLIIMIIFLTFKEKGELKNRIAAFLKTNTSLHWNFQNTHTHKNTHLRPYRLTHTKTPTYTLTHTHKHKTIKEQLSTYFAGGKNHETVEFKISLR